MYVYLITRNFCNKLKEGQTKRGYFNFFNFLLVPLV